MAEVLKSEPAWAQLPAETPQAVVTLLRRCLEKDPRRRLSSIGDIALTLDETTRLVSPAPSSGGTSRNWLQRAIAPGSPSPPDSRMPDGRRLGALAVFVVLGGAILLWKPWKTADRSTVESARATVAPRSSEIARLRLRIQPDRWQKEDFDVVSASLDRLLQANPEDAEAWALHSIIHSMQVMRPFSDMGTRPLTIGKTSAARALHLAPGMPLAELAMGMHLTAMISRGGDPAAAREHLARGIAGLPDDPIAGYAEIASSILSYHFEEAQQAAMRWLAHDPQASFPAWIMAQCSLLTRRPAEVEKWAEQAAKDNNITAVKALISLFDERYYLQADLAGARAALERANVGDRTSHRMVFSRWLLAMAERKWDMALQELARLPEDMLFDRCFHGPKTLLSAMAHQAAGRDEVAQIQFGEADRSLVQELAHDPSNEELHAVRAVTLAEAGHGTEARTELSYVEPQLRDRAPTGYTSTLYALVAQTYGVLGDTDRMLPWLRLAVSGPVEPAVHPGFSAP
jgi:hypothetical protein